MRTFVFTLLAMAAGTVIQFGLTHLSYSVEEAMHGFDIVLMFVLPVAVTAGLARAMRIPHVGYVIVLSILSAFSAWMLAFFFTYDVLNEPLHYL